MKKRFSDMQQHSGEHIFSGVAHSLCGVDNVGFHMGETSVTVDFNSVITDEELKKIEILSNEENSYYLNNKEQYRLFLDLEFTMPPYDYQHGSGFVAEIIQYGAYLEDPDGNMITSLNANVKPSNNDGLNARTFNFLNVSMSDFRKAESPYEFYRKLKDVIMLYQPIIYVWGKNDILMLNNFYEKYKLKPLVERQKIVNLMQVIKNYYNIKTDIGLFNAYHLFGRSSVEEQDHNSLHDAVATAEVFKLFQNEIS